MQNVKEFYIIGDDEEPIETEIGKCYFITVRGYLTFMSYVHYLNLAKYEMDEEIIEVFGGNMADLITEMSIMDMIHNFKEQLPYYIYYKAMFELCFKEDVFDKVKTDEDFEKYRTLIRDMNCVKLKEINPNPEIQKWIDKSLEAKKSEGGGIGFKEIITSVSVTKCLDYKKVNDMTVYQLFADFYRIAKIKGYDTSTLFATVATEKVDIEDWCASTEVIDTPQGLSQEAFGQLTSSMFN